MRITTSGTPLLFVKPKQPSDVYKTSKDVFEIQFTGGKSNYKSPTKEELDELREGEGGAGGHFLGEIDRQKLWNRLAGILRDGTPKDKGLLTDGELRALSCWTSTDIKRLAKAELKIREDKKPLETP